MLDSVAVPTTDAPPEKSSTDKAGEALGGAAKQLGSGLFDALWLPLALVGASVLIYLVGVRGTRSSQEQEAA
jgi:NADH:ubiquinone oxidoreductase subunit 6 (subunit J)